MRHTGAGRDAIQQDGKMYAEKEEAVAGRVVLLDWRVQMTTRFVPECGARKPSRPDGYWRLGNYCEERPN